MRIRAEVIEHLVREAIIQFADEMDWNPTDNIVVDIGGTSVSGIDVGEDYNPKWSKPLGTVTRNKDAFLVIKNLSKNPVESSKPMEKFEPHNEYEPVDK